MRKTQIQKVPVWQTCPDCEDFLCSIHGCHVADCECPGIEFWAALDIDPYTYMIAVDNEGASGV